MIGVVFVDKHSKLVIPSIVMMAIGLYCLFSTMLLLIGITSVYTILPPDQTDEAQEIHHRPRKLVSVPRVLLVLLYAFFYLGVNSYIVTTILIFVGHYA